ncbi:MAG: hypothetical protein KDI88_09625 [Gammaproteobacteria bacterium]|nr:hypothetical protein [Gammaproteobacteria bacterium]
MTKQKEPIYYVPEGWAEDERRKFLDDWAESEREAERQAAAEGGRGWLADDDPFAGGLNPERTKD